MTSEGSERVERREECEEHVDDDEFRQQMRELIGEVKEQINREEAEGGVESGDANKERDTKAEREATDIDEESGSDNEFRREMQELIAEVREISKRNESEDSDEFRRQMRELIDEVERELDADGEIADSAEDRLDEFEEDVLENFEKYCIDGDEVRERWRERFVEDVEEELEKDSASDELDESTKASDDAADSEMTETAESHSYSESGDGTVQVLKTEGSSEATESVNESEEHKAEMEPQPESDSSVEGEKDRPVEESNQKEDLEPPKAEKQPEKKITHETESETSENGTQHELNRNSKENIPETSEDAQARQQTSEAVSESSEEKVEAAERKETQAESIKSYSARVECEEEAEDTQTEGHLNESDEEEGEVIQDSGSERMQEWTEDGESEELAEPEHLEEPDSTQSTLESNQEVLEVIISPDAEEIDEDEEVDEQVASDDERLTGMLDSPYPTVYVDETGFFAETEEQRWRRKLIELYNELPEEMKQLYRELVKDMLESEEGLEKLLDTFPELREYEDFEEEHEDAIKYVKFRQKIREFKLLATQEETIVKELALELDIDQETVKKWLNDDYDSFPKIIQQVWNQEIERRWGSVLKAIANRDVPYDMSEVNDILKRFPELRRKRRFGWHYDEVKAWTEVIAAKRQSKIATLIIQGKERFKLDEVKELAARLNLTIDIVVSWLREESRPWLVDVLAGNKTTQNEGLPEIVKHASPESMRKCSSEPISDDDGSFSIDENTEGERKPERQHKKHWSEAREVRAHPPRISGQEIRSFDKLKKMIQNEFPGIQDRNNYDSLLEGADNYFKLLEAIGERKALEKYEVRSMATNLGIKARLVQHWTFDGTMPRMFRILERATKVKQRAAELKGQLRGLQSWSDVQKGLDSVFPHREYEKSNRYQLRKCHVMDFFKILKMSENGATMRDISQRSGISQKIVVRFLTDQLPHFIRLVLASRDPTRTDSSLFRKVDYWSPKVCGIHIETIEQLEEIVKRDFPGFAEREDFPRLLKVAEVHLELIRHYHDRAIIPRGIPSHVHRATQVPLLTIIRWVSEGVKPNIYELLDNALTASDAMEKWQGLRSRLKGVTSTEEMKRRLGHSYIQGNMLNPSEYNKGTESVQRFFRFLEALPRGGTISDVARRAGFKPKDIASWFHDDKIPKCVRIASFIPTESPQDRKMWLPLKITSGRQPVQFIQVPVEIVSPQDILDVLEKTQSLRTREMRRYEKQFGEMPKHIAFMYLLGVIISDGYFGKPMRSSTNVGLTASKKYSWSAGLGRGFCYSLGKIGIYSTQDRNRVLQQKSGKITVNRIWRSLNSPLLEWMRRTLLGLTTSTPKSQTPIQIDWILQMPEDWRVALLQGIADGDGCASIRSYNAFISSQTNQSFLVRLLGSLGIQARPTPHSVEIENKKSIRKANALPLFKHALGRQETLMQLVDMFHWTEQRGLKRIPPEEIKVIMNLHNQGFSSGQITETLWSRLGVARHPSSIRRIIKRM